MITNNTTINGNQEFDMLIGILQSHGLIIPNWLILSLIIIILIAKMLGYIDSIYDALIKVKNLSAIRYSYDQKQFIGLRNNFIKHLVYEVERLNREADWADFNYTELEAEVEVDPIIDWNLALSNRTIVFFRSFYYTIRSLMGLYPATRIEKSLISAIMNSKSHAFLIIGDPGSGKTVSLKHLFLKMSEICLRSGNGSAVLPIYINLKDLNVEPYKVCAKKIDEWVLEKLRAGQDRTIHEFLDSNFSTMLKQGTIFFLFDSFDEIPAVIDAEEEHEVVRQYAKALDDFLHSQHQCRGLVSSRPYRAPKTFMGQRLTIRPLSDNRIKEALYKYMGKELPLAKKLWQELYQYRGDILQISRNPFYLALLAGYVKDKKILPERHYDLFEHFVQIRALADKNRLSYFGLSPSDLIQKASILAFSMTQANNIGLSAKIDQINQITRNYDQEDGWDRDKIESLLDALCYSKLGRILQEEIGEPKVFSFVHRRFHEYFCARYIREKLTDAPIERFSEDDRWREVLILLCEVLPTECLIKIFQLIRSALYAGEKSKSGSIEHRKAIETIRFLKDGFRSRINDIPQDIRLQCSNFIRKQFEEGNPIDQKRATEATSIADEGSIHSILELALASQSPRVRETAIRSCRILRVVSMPIAVEIRNYLYQRYCLLQLIRDYNSYSVLFSSPPSLHPFGTYLRVLLYMMLIQSALMLMIYPLGFLFDPMLIVSLIGSFFIFNFFFAYLDLIGLHRKTAFRSGGYTRRVSFLSVIDIFQNPWTIQWLVLLYFSILTIYSRIYVRNFALLDSIINTKIIYILAAISTFFLISNFILKDLISNYRDGFNLISCYPKIIIKFSNKMIESINVNNLKNAGIISFSGGILGLIIYLISKAWAIIGAQGYSIMNIYNTYGLFVASLILLAALVIGLFTLVAAISFLFVCYKTSLLLIRIIRDQVKFRSLSMIPENRPKTTDEAIQILHSFKSDWCRVQYANALLKWMPNGEEPQLLIEEADQIRNSGKYSVEVAEAIYALAEV